MLFRTEIITRKYNFHFDYNHKYFLMGSCFSDHIGKKLYDRHFHTCSNPFGTCFNPISISKSLTLLNNEEYGLSIHQNPTNGLYFHYGLHSSFNSLDKEGIFNKIGHSITDSKVFLTNTDLTFITLGTAWVYELKSNQEVVSNCHKMDSYLFNKRILSVEECNEAIKLIVAQLKSFNSKMKILFTLSPVRHTKDGLVENSLSKSTLLYSIYQNVDHEQTYYFPSYEIMMDDLRDYRFYKEDMIHPTDQAIDYIWEKLCASLFDESTLLTMKNVEIIKKFLNHRPQIRDKNYEENVAMNMQKLDDLRLNFGCR
jgi:hypothetical protein